ncbi:hypothetical protein PLESTB_000843500 [Pleodorina starrii]|uniref:Choline transporter-like protein n=1 Tax=Pleodorina starrii TaxID=330485 RepID=A0A9W6F3B2_9CHLO|nr:hypothetical protein PLESTM_000159200 [Pleodorina starrii]GLC54285.1 hypothetical protein PLESTB_000843500 [Pleodorina starrii]GLC64414.1 hypothetical protein PLESTF_000163300 [Pleodorina starrii]
MSTDASFEPNFGLSYVEAYVPDENAFSYNKCKRPRRDALWTLAYVSLAAITLAGSIPVFLRTDRDTGLYSNRFFNNSTSCDVQRYQQVAWMYNDAEYDPTFMRRFKAEATVWLPATAGLAALGSAAYLLLFSRFPRTLLGALSLGSLVAGLGLSALSFAAGALPAGVVLVACTAGAAGLFLWTGRWVRPLAELMTLAALSLQRNPRLVLAALGIKLVGLLVLAYGFAAFFSAVNYGYVSQNWDAVQRFAVGDENGFCINAQRERIPCCAFMTHAWAYAYAAAAAVFLLWSAALVLQLRTFAAADTLAQSYFAAATPAYSTFTIIGPQTPAGAGGGGGGGAVAASGSVRRALRHCLAASFGSLALAAAALASLRAVRCTSGALMRLRGVGRLLRPLALLTASFSRFVPIAAAITGRPFLPAARAVSELLHRNHLPCYGLWWVPSGVLQAAAALLALAWSGLVFLLTFSSNKQYEPVVLPVSFATAGASFLLMLYGLLFTVGLQLDAVHTLYICYAADVDQQQVTRPDVHAVIRQVPSQALQYHRNALVYGTSSMPQPGAAATAAAAGATPTATPDAVAGGMEQLPAFAGIDGAEAPSPLPGFPGSPPSRLKRRAL